MNGTMESMINDKIHPYRFPVDFAEFIFPNRSETLFDSVVSAMIVYTEIVIKAVAMPWIIRATYRDKIVFEFENKINDIEKEMIALIKINFLPTLSIKLPIMGLMIMSIKEITEKSPVIWIAFISTLLLYIGNKKEITPPDNEVKINIFLNPKFSPLALLIFSLLFIMNKPIISELTFFNNYQS